MSFEVREIGKNEEGQPIYMVIRFNDEGFYKTVVSYEMTTDDIEGAKLRLSELTRGKASAVKNIFNTAGLYNNGKKDSDLDTQR